MKKKAALLLTGLCVLAMLAGCGKEKTEDKKNGTENKANTEVSKADIEKVTLGEYNGLEITVEKAEVTEEKVIEYINTMLEKAPGYEETDKTVVENGDTVNIDYTGFLKEVYEGPETDPEKGFEGGSTKGNGAYLEIGSKSYIDGFEDGLIGANVGDQRELELTFPENYGNADMAGKEVVFVVKVNSIVEPKVETLDTITDEFVESNFTSVGYKTVQELKDGVSETLNASNDYYVETNKRNAILDKLMEVCTIEEVPEKLLNSRVDEYLTQFEAMCKDKFNMEVKDYLQQKYQTTEEEFKTQTVEYMTDNLKLEMVLLAIVEKENVELDEEGYKTFISNMMKNYQIASEEALNEEYGEEFLKNSYLCNKATDVVLDNAKITYVEPKAADKEEDSADDAE